MKNTSPQPRKLSFTCHNSVNKMINESFFTCHYAVPVSWFVDIYFIDTQSTGRRKLPKEVHGPLTRYVKLRVAHAPGMPGTFSPPPRFSDPDMHHSTCVTYVPRCIPGSLTSGFLWSYWRGKTFPAFPAHAQSAILRIWQEVHAMAIGAWHPCSSHRLFLSV